MMQKDLKNREPTVDKLNKAVSVELLNNIIGLVWNGIAFSDIIRQCPKGANFYGQSNHNLTFLDS